MKQGSIFHVHPERSLPSVQDPRPGSAIMSRIPLPSFRMLRCSALVAIAVLIPFGAAPVFAQAVADAQPGSAAGRSGPLIVVNSSVSRVMTIVRSHPAGPKRSSERRGGEVPAEGGGFAAQAGAP